MRIMWILLRFNSLKNVDLGRESAGALLCGSEVCAKHRLVVRSKQLGLWAWAQSPALPFTAWPFSVKEEIKQLKGFAQAPAPRK